MKKTLLWRVSPADGGPDSWLFGTMHVRDLRAFGLLDTLYDHIDRCEVFATEFNFAEIDQLALAKAMMLPAGRSLDKMLKPGAWKSFTHLVQKRLDQQADLFRFQHPMAMSSMLSASMLAEEVPQSLDETLWEYAQRQGKKMTGVESFEDQINTIKKIDLQQQADALGWLVKNFGKQKKRLKRMLRWYEQGNLEQLYQSAKRDAKGMRRVMLYDRNRNMADRFAEIAQHESLFCAVGAGHLAGEKGMLRLLKKSGFKIKPVVTK